MWSAPPWLTAKVSSAPAATAPLVPFRVTEPAVVPVTVLVATPFNAVAAPSPLTFPAPPSLAKVTTRVLFDATVFPAASLIVAVSTRSAPEARPGMARNHEGGRHSSGYGNGQLVTAARADRTIAHADSGGLRLVEPHGSVIATGDGGHTVAERDRRRGAEIDDCSGLINDRGS